jgi:hypothetical protein
MRFSARGGIMHHRSGTSVLILIALVIVPGVATRAQTPAAARPVAYEPLARTTAKHLQTGSSQFRIKAVSGRNDMISGGDALVAMRRFPSRCFTIR